MIRARSNRSVDMPVGLEMDLRRSSVIDMNLVGDKALNELEAVREEEEPEVKLSPEVETVKVADQPEVVPEWSYLSEDKGLTKAKTGEIRAETKTTAGLTETGNSGGFQFLDLKVSTPMIKVPT